MCVFGDFDLQKCANAKNAWGKLSSSCVSEISQKEFQGKQVFVNILNEELMELDTAICDQIGPHDENKTNVL